MDPTQWYELRVVGSAGTAAGSAAGLKEGIALTEHGRLCAVTSGNAKRFGTAEEALEFLGKTSMPGVFNLEPVLCGEPAALGNPRRA